MTQVAVPGWLGEASPQAGRSARSWAGHRGSSCNLPAVRDHALAEELDRLHDLLVGRSARVRVPEAQQERLGTGRLLPAMKLAHTRLRFAEDEAIWREILERALRACRDRAEFRELGV